MTAPLPHRSRMLLRRQVMPAELHGLRSCASVQRVPAIAAAAARLQGDEDVQQHDTEAAQ